MKLKVNKKLFVLLMSGASLALSGCELQDEVTEVRNSINRKLVNTVIEYMDKHDGLLGSSISDNEVSENVIVSNNVVLGDKPEHEVKTLDKDSVEYNAFECDYVECVNKTNIYEGDSVDSKVIGYFIPGRAYEFMEDFDDEWYLINYFDQMCYVKKSDTKVVGKDIMQVPMIAKGYVQNDSMLYTNKELSEEKLLLDKFEFVEIYKELNDCYLVQTIDTIGYIPKESVTLLEGNMAVVDISEQELRVYINDIMAKSSPVVTGCVSAHTESDQGLFKIWGQYENFYMTPPNSAWVETCDYYNSACEAIHTAGWRTMFGGDIYLTSGSHGCINSPDYIAHFVHENLTTGDHVLVKK